MFRSILPKEFDFFSLFAEHAAGTLDAIREMQNFASGHGDTSESLRRLEEKEHMLDVVTRRCTDALQTTFITPFERADIHRLIKRMDSINDGLYRAASDIAMFNMFPVRAEMRDMVVRIEQMALSLQEAIKQLHNSKAMKEVLEHCYSVRKQKDEFEHLAYGALKSLYAQDNAILVIQWKDVYAKVLKAADRCQDTANTIESILISAY